MSKIRDTFEKLRGFDLSFFAQQRLTRQILKEADFSEPLLLSLAELQSIHPMDGVAESKIAGRVETLRGVIDQVRDKGILSAKDLEALLPSSGKMRGVRDRLGRVVLFDGNGRFVALREAFSDLPNLLIEVEVYEFNHPQDPILSSLDEIRSRRGLL